MTVILRTTFTINGGEDTTRDLTVATTEDASAMDIFGLMNLAADSLIQRGQIMVSGAELITHDALAV